MTVVDPRLSGALRSGAVVTNAPVSRPGAAPATPRSGDASAFRSALDDARVAPGTGFRFSAHAEQRLRQRGVSFDASQLQRLEAGIDAAAGKGSREALVLVDGVAMVVAIGNRTVVTAVPGDEGSAPSVFTNIDSAVIT